MTSNVEKIMVGKKITLHSQQAYGNYVHNDTLSSHFALPGEYTIISVDGNAIVLLSKKGDKFKCHKNQLLGW